MKIPSATYRLQFTPDFGFAEASEVLPYLHDLGISDIYASPIFHARAGSRHGYDVVDHGQLNPELGTRADFDRLVAALHGAIVKQAGKRCRSAAEATIAAPAGARCTPSGCRTS